MCFKPDGSASDICCCEYPTKNGPKWLAVLLTRISFRIDRAAEWLDSEAVGVEVEKQYNDLAQKHVCLGGHSG